MSDNPFAEPKADLDFRATSPDTDAERIRREHLKAETNIKSIGMLYIAGGAFGTFVGALGLLAFVIALFRGEGFGIGAFEAVLVGALAAIYPAVLFTGIALRRFRMWARYTAVAFSSIGLLTLPLGTIISGLFLFILLNKKASTVFTPEYQEIIRQTPHIQYKTSPVAWAALGIIVLLLLFGLFSFGRLTYR